MLWIDEIGELGPDDPPASSGFQARSYGNRTGLFHLQSKSCDGWLYRLRNLLFPQAYAR